MIRTTIFIIFCIGVIALQVFLSKKQTKWLGLILPLTSLLFSLLAVLNIATFTTFKLTEQIVIESGEVINNAVSSGIDNRDVSSAIFTAIYVFILYNIPTAILVAIYFACHEKFKKNKEIEKMTIQDLE